MHDVLFFFGPSEEPANRNMINFLDELLSDLAVLQNKGNIKRR